LKKQLRRELKHHRIIKISTCNQISILFKNIFNSCIERVSFPRENKLWRLYEDGQDRIDKEFDIVKIIKSLRNLKIFIKRQFLFDKKLKVEISNQGNNVINLDSDEISSITSFS